MHETYDSFNLEATRGDPLAENDTPVLRNGKKSYKPLERLFGTMTQGMAFGESCMFVQESSDF
jgi:hypothetical protein